MKKHYPDVEANPNFPALEEDVLKFWASDGTFEKSVSQRDAANAYVFYDGPPFANGLPHYGHLLTGYVKDAVARYQTMNGKRVERRFGWDCHGLPAEMGAEKELGISGRAAITGFGIGKFNEHCRTSVMKYTSEWEYYVNRQGRWVDFKNDYKTMDTPFMESCLWAFKELWNKGLIYESMRVMPYSWAAETPVSNFETRIDNATREREDLAAYVKFRLREKPQGAPEAENYYLIAWTTTPWTLPSNLALAVNAEMEYRHYVVGNECLIIAKSVIPAKAGIQLNEEQLDASFRWHDVKGAALAGLKYEPLFPYFARYEDATVAGVSREQISNHRKNIFSILVADFVTDGDGTGIVHIAPGFGEDDNRLGVENGLPVLVPVDEKGRFTSEIFDIPYKSSPLVGEHASHWASGGGNEKQLANARAMRKEPTQQEAILWKHLKGEQLEGFKFRRQESIGDYIVDFVAYEARLIVEADGGQHATDSEYERKRSLFLESQGFKILRFWNNEINENLAGVLEIVQSALKSPHGSLRSPAPPQGGSENMLSLCGLVVVPDTRTPEADIVVSDDDKAQHIAAKDVAKYGLANMRIVRWLKANNKLVKSEPFKHNYPHCWRTDTPLIYRAMSSWYVNVQKIKANMAANNQTIHWIPEHVRDGQMGKGIESAPDWSISRNRFWGTPIPIWKSASGKMHVCGSIEEIEKHSGVKVTDLHRPFIDDVKLTIDGEEYTRIEDVFDCWFESGSMPYAQVHYPFENKAQFEKTFPADFITEYIAQTRGWFYTLQVLSAALFGCAPFKNVICHGVVIDEETGLKYSKRLKNYRDPKEVMDQFGADALRWMMLASPVMRGADLGVDPDGKFIRDIVRLNIKPIWNAYNFFTLYANADGVQAKSVLTPHPNPLPQGEGTSNVRGEGADVLDRYILAKCKAAVGQVKASLDAYDTPSACEAISGFFEVLNNWYIRRSKDRFWAEEVNDDKQAAYDTLFTVLNLMCKAAAPLLPFTTEAIYRGLNTSRHSSESWNPDIDSSLRGNDNVESVSVHLQDFPDVSAIADEAQLITDMDRVQNICNAALAVRNKLNIRVRQPLESIRIAANTGDIAQQWKERYGKVIADIIKDEVNVKSVDEGDMYTDDVATKKLAVNSAVLGKRLPQKMKEILPASKKGDWQVLATGEVIVAGEKLLPSEYQLSLEPKAEYADRAQPLSTNDALVILDTNITPELEAEGLARDMVRMVQQARKDAGLHVSDRIALVLELPTGFKPALAHRDYIAEQTLAVSLAEGDASAADHSFANEVDGERVVIGISRAA